MGSGGAIWLVVLGVVIVAAVIAVIVWRSSRRRGGGAPEGGEGPVRDSAAGTWTMPSAPAADQAAVGRPGVDGEVGAAGPGEDLRGPEAPASPGPGSAAPAAAAPLPGAPGAAPELEVPEAPASRLQRLRARLAGSKSVLGKTLLAVLSRGQLDQDDWDEFEETLLAADVGAAASEEILEAVRTAMQVEGAGADAAQTLRRELLAAVTSPAARTINDQGPDGQPGVILVVGVNGSGKTTTIGRLARLEAGQGNTVILGAADTFRAAAAEQLATWAERVGVQVVRGPEGSDPASVAFEAVAAGIDQAVNTVIIDTAGRLHNKANLMAELEKIKRVASKRAAITETLLVLDATTGQNGLTQARVFTEAVDVTGIVLTKLDG
ncbi:MAG: signal recognition particle-docking protein FtsY, partial [Bifidobacteriaceae bacterium]|nr:signal recognition particle-docking protein FtsY [Bifidobacteriaceae bacterium]